MNFSNLFPVTSKPACATLSQQLGATQQQVERKGEENLNEKSFGIKKIRSLGCFGRDVWALLGGDPYTLCPRQRERKGGNNWRGSSEGNHCRVSTTPTSSNTQKARF